MIPYPRPRSGESIPPPCTIIANGHTDSCRRLVSEILVVKPGPGGGKSEARVAILCSAPEETSQNPRNENQNFHILRLTTAWKERDIILNDGQSLYHWQILGFREAIRQQCMSYLTIDNISSSQILSHWYIHATTTWALDLVTVRKKIQKWEFWARPIVYATSITRKTVPKWNSLRKRSTRI